MVKVHIVLPSVFEGHFTNYTAMLRPSTSLFTAARLLSSTS